MATAPLHQTIGRSAYTAAQLARIGWHMGHYMIGRRHLPAITPPGHVPVADEFSPLDRSHLSQRFRDLFVQEWDHIRAGMYKRPIETRALPDIRRLIDQSRDYLRDSHAVAARQARGIKREVFAEPHRNQYPGYYLQNFHYQSDGWLSEGSARRYDMQVETLFTGAAGAMRRLALPFIADALKGRDAGDTHLVDLGCGGAPLLGDILDNWPRLSVTGIDLSTAYLARAQCRLSDHRQCRFIKRDAEATGLADGDADIVIAVYLFHELPPKARAGIAREIARILKPGGMFILLDTLQYGDDPGLDILLENFPRAFHEPYFDSYCRSALADIFAPAGLDLESETTGFLSKASRFRRRKP